jgi:nucleoside-diphosphate-sugar epimerase
VTGGTGFIGRHAVTSLLATGWEVHVAARDADQAPIGANVHNVDLLQAHSAMKLVAAVAPDTILHLAWCVEPGVFWTDPTNLDWVAASLRLAQAATAGGVSHFIGAGTCFEYAWPADSPCVESSTPLAAHTLYDTAKASAAAIIDKYFRHGSTRFAWARLFCLYGPGQSPSRFVASLARALMRGEPARSSRGLVTRDFLDVRDAGAALAAVAVSRHAGPVNIGSGAPVRLADLARRLANLAGRPDLLELGALPDRANEPPWIVADVGILRGRIGFEPKYDLDSALRAALIDANEREGVHG